MKKLALIIAVAGIVGLSSCSKKCNTCSFGTSEVEYCSDDYTSAQLNAAESACKLSGGEWE